jgi:molecular chaperone GrpE
MSEENKTMPEAPDISGEESGASGGGDDSELSLLREQLRIKEEEAKSANDRFLRQGAEVENFKKRVLREKEDAIRYGNESLVKDLLPVVDNLERAICHARMAGQSETFVTGVEMVLTGLLDVLGRYDVTQIAAVGQPFNPEVHEAVAQVESDNESSNNTVLEEHQKGYLLKERLLRPALVTVARGSKPQDKKNPGGPVENTPTDD